MSQPLVGRFLARVVDVALLAALLAGAGQLTGFGPGWLVGGALAVLSYFAGFDAALGTTPGKRLLGLRVVTAEGTRPTLVAALRRESFTLLGAIPFVGPFAALGVWIWFLVVMRRGPDGAGPHDRLAGTRVVRG